MAHFFDESLLIFIKIDISRDFLSKNYSIEILSGHEEMCARVFTAALLVRV